jgi:hypothetical protein
VAFVTPDGKFIADWLKELGNKKAKYKDVK